MKLTKVVVLSKTPNPQRTAALAMHGCYSELPLSEQTKWMTLDETVAGRRVVDKCLKYGHWGVCYDKTTEVLTKDGWKLWPDVTDTDLLYSVDLNTQKGHWERPSKLIKLKYTGDLVNISHKRIKLAVTPDHRVVTKRRVSGGSYADPKVELAKDIYGTQLKMLSSAELKNPSFVDYTENELKLIGFWIGDGCQSRLKKRSKNTMLKFKLKRQRKIDFLYSLGFDIEQRGNVYYLNVGELAHWIELNCVNNKNKVLPASFEQLNRTQFLPLWEGLRQSDGKHRHKTLINAEYRTSSEQLARQLDTLVSLCGFSSKLSNHEHTNKKWNTSYFVTVLEQNEFRLEKENYSKTFYDDFVYCATVSTGVLMVRKEGVTTVSGNCEHNSITLSIEGYPHSVMQQLRTHRHLSVAAQSARYTGQRFVQWTLVHGDNLLSRESVEEFEKLFYFREPGSYADRFGNKIDWTEDVLGQSRYHSMKSVATIVQRYLIEKKMPFEMVRDILPAGYRQNFVVTGNARSMMHLLSLRLPKDAQLEIAHACEGIKEHMEEWMPEVMEFYNKKYAYKSKLTP